MKVIKQNVYRVEYNTGFDSSVLVEADSIIEAMEVAKAYYKLEDSNIRGVHTYTPVIKKLTKTVTVEL